MEHVEGLMSGWSAAKNDLGSMSKAISNDVKDDIDVIPNSQEMPLFSNGRIGRMRPIRSLGRTTSKVSSGIRFLSICRLKFTSPFV